MGSSNWNSLSLIMLSTLCWGLGTVLSKGILAHMPPLTLLVIQLAVSVTFLWLIVVFQRLKLPSLKKVIRPGLTGLLEPGLAYTFGLLGLSLTTASMAALIWAAEPILILGLAWLILGERLTRPLLALTVVAISGVFLVIGVNTGQAGSLAGNLLTLVGVFCCALYVTLSRRLVTNMNPLLLVTLQQSVALVWALLIWPIEFFSSGMAPLAALTPAVWLWTVISGIVYYALAFWFYITGLKNTPASQAGLFFNLIPIFSVGGAYLFLGERLAPVQWLGAALILTAVVTLVLRRESEVEAVPAP
ncbi:MAG TPA: DMT family transporter [Anaerolineae bacterium]